MEHEPSVLERASIATRLWVYTNFDCNLSCSYCLSSSSPSAARRRMPPGDFRQLIDEAVSAGIEGIYLTGGEPFLLPDICEMIDYAACRAPVTVLTNGLLLQGKRLERLTQLRDRDLTLQVSLDGHLPELHDAYRGEGTWARTVEAIRRLQTAGLTVAIGATGTPVNQAYAAELRSFAACLGIPDERFFMRPLTRTGLSAAGLQLDAHEMVPELTVTLDGVYWHPQTGGASQLLSRSYLPLRPALDLINATYDRITAGGSTPQVYRCA